MSKQYTVIYNTTKTMHGGKSMKSIFLLIGVSLLFVSVGAHAGEWIVDSKTGCKSWNPNPLPNETISWSGECVDGYTSGLGTEIWYKDGKENGYYKGEMRRGKMDGKGAYTWANGNKYEGDYVDGKRTGKGSFSWANGDKYIGDFVDGKRTGKGIYTWANGNKYEGDFVDGKGTGKGTFNGNKYEGTWDGGW
ncbi:MAG TPA: hypothetical protein VHO84_02310 [Syntrophorhabdaceae bacterium]|nr:hypothetical protein [Syntrophorhabdaceae bacterium]